MFSRPRLQLERCVVSLCRRTFIHSTKYLRALFILSGVYLLLNAASYDGEILQADAYRPCAGHVLGFKSTGVVVIGLDFCSGVLRLWVGRWDRRQ